MSFGLSLSIKLPFCDIFHICLCKLLPESDNMKVLSKSLWIAAVVCFKIFLTTAIEFQEPEQEITTEYFGFSSYATTDPSTESSSNGANAIDSIPEEVISNEAQFQRKEKSSAEEPETISFAFPSNHKNFTGSQYLGNGEYPPYFNHLNSYQQQYKNYYEHKQLYNTKPIKFEENSNKNLYLSQGVNSFLEPEKKPDKSRVTRKPFPYEFEKKKVSENWYKSTGHELASEEPKYQDKSPYYVFPNGGLYEQKFYKNELVHHDHHDHHEVTKDDKNKNPWKNVFKYLTALVPLGLLLATLTPNVIAINSTANAKTLRQRSEDDIPMKSIKEEDVMRLLKQYGLQALNDSQCEDRLICELAARGHEPNANAIERSFWYLANETPKDVADKTGMNGLFKAIKTGTCESFKCRLNSVLAVKSSSGKKLVKKRKTLAPEERPGA